MPVHVPRTRLLNSNSHQSFSQGADWPKSNALLTTLSSHLSNKRVQARQERRQVALPHPCTVINHPSQIPPIAPAATEGS